MACQKISWSYDSYSDYGTLCLMTSFTRKKNFENRKEAGATGRTKDSSRYVRTTLHFTKTRTNEIHEGGTLSSDFFSSISTFAQTWAHIICYLYLYRCGLT